MKYIVSLFGLVAFWHQTSSQPSTVTVGSTMLDVRVVIPGPGSQYAVNIPWEIRWGTDNHIWMTERVGRVSRLNPETGQRFIILDISNSIYNTGEAGLLGMQLHPDFENNPFVYLAHTFSDGQIKERVVRYTYDSSSGMLEDPYTLIDDIRANYNHSGCRLLIMPDNTMLVSTGDYLSFTAPQDLSSSSGKILRMNLDGSIPSDNPFGPSSYIYSLGHRNAQGLVLAPNGNVYSSEHGPTSNDELNVIVAGANYGWPIVQGYCNTSSELLACDTILNYEEPIAIWYENSTIAPSDLIWYDHPAIPEWKEKLLMTTLKAQHLKVIEVDTIEGTDIISEEILFNEGHAADSTEFDPSIFGRLRDICAAPDGRVFLATNSSYGIVELKNSSYVNGLDELTRLPVSITPNPNDGIFSLKFPKRMLHADFRLTDVAGRIVRKGSVEQINMEIDLSSDCKGIYFLKVNKDNYTSVERILVTH
ncbi:MAG: PQQ-dependent sugar dehydrogenase [Flavobacteriales bacterium]|nr:PQQ-dependent sugar dehydrogenase [Flavobacteriales bacterium]